MKQLPSSTEVIIPEIVDTIPIGAKLVKDGKVVVQTISFDSETQFAQRYYTVWPGCVPKKPVSTSILSSLFTLSYEWVKKA